MNFSGEQIERYSRNILLSEVGGVGQNRLLSSRVLLVGAGGLGSPAGLYLAAAGVGKIGLVDGDVVDLSNLQRQIAHNTAALGQPKVESAAATFKALNPDVQVRTYFTRLTAANAADILADYDIVIDGTDSFASKFLIADACYFTRKPYVHAGVLRFEGQLMTVLPGESTCYRCVFRSPPPSSFVPSCLEAGVLGAVAGVIGTLQAVEALKFLLGKGTLLTDRLMIYNGLQASFRTVKLQRSKVCPLCGDNPVITVLRDEFCKGEIALGNA